MVKEYKGYSIAIEQDESPESPRDWDNLGTMVCGHRRYNLGDKQIPDHYYNDKGEYIEITSMPDIKAWIESTYGELAVILPLGLYDHSGITMYVGDTHDRWDGGAVGYIFVTKERVRKEYNVKRISPKLSKMVEGILHSEVKTYDTYLRGEVVGYNVEGIDSCWGFYSVEDAIAEAESSIDYHIAELQKKKEQKLKSYIKSSVPLQYRTL